MEIRPNLYSMKKRLILLTGWLCLFIFTLQGANFPYYHFKQLSIKEGLPSSVTALYSDTNNSLWVGTAQGVYRFDGEEIKKFALPCELRTGSHYINYIEGDKQDRIWVLTSKGIAYYEHNQDSLQILLHRQAPIKASIVYAEGENLIIPITDTLLVYNKELKLSRTIPFSSNKLRIITMLAYDTQHYLVNTERSEIKLMEKHTGKLKEPPFSETSNVHFIYKDSSGRFWISYYGKGVKCYSREGKLLTSYDTHNSSLSNDFVLDIEEWDGTIWLATDGGGVNIIYPDTRDIQILSTQKDQHFPANSVSSLCQSNNHMWIGMVREGVLGAQKNFITTYTKASLDPTSGLSEKCPLCLWEDSDGSIWIGTDGGGINRFDPQTERFTHYPQTAGGKIVSICPLSETELLLSSFTKGFFRLNKKTGSYQPFHLPDKDIEEKMVNSGAPVNLRVNENGEIELYGALVCRYIPSEHKLVRIPINLKNLLATWLYFGQYRSYPFFHDRRNIFQYNKEKEQFEILFYQENNQILAAGIDMTGTLWASGPKGVNRYFLSSNRKENIKLPDGNDVVTSLIIDHEGIVWMGSLGVLYAYDPVKNHFVIYNTMDGVLPNDFLPKPVLVASDGNVYMGGAEGLVRINKKLKGVSMLPPVTLRLRKVVLNGATLPSTRHSNLRVNNDFSSLDIHALPDGSDVFHKRIYRFRIHGLNNGYIELAQPHLILHTLPPGEFQITAQCTQNDGNWSPEFTLLNLTVLPPWWGSKWFITLCIGIAILLAVYMFRLHDRKLQRKLQERERKIYKDKVRALININHELRTPLTLIYSPLKQLTNSKQIPYELRTKLQSAFKQARQMKNIIDMILNMRKMEVEQNILRMSSVSFNEWLQGILDDFKEEFLMRNITLTYAPDPTIQTMYFDSNQCEIIVNNLLTNAYKFSDADSTVTVYTELEGGNSRIRISVKDEGIGLQKEDMEHLFTRFYQGKHTLQGSGIGLSYAKQLVEMHGGIIGARNNESKGSTFFFTLPYRQEAASITSVPQIQLNNILPGELDISGQKAQNISAKFHSILIVEDDRDLCSFLVCNLQAVFEKVYEAHDGMEALPVLTSCLPQLVLCDVKMPRMNGFDLCRYIKQKPELNYIPVILLTSCVDNEILEEGYKMGAEAYVTKPFDMDLLIIQIQNILQNHNIVKKHYSTIEIPKQMQEDLTPMNEHLLLQLNHIINENISNVDMDVNFIAKQMGMSRSSLYNKTKGMMEMGINEYIIKCRMEYACRLLETTSLSIGEISERSGFRHPRNFSTLFKNAAGQSPSDYRKEKKGTPTE